MSTNTSINNELAKTMLGEVNSCDIAVLVDNYPDNGLETAWGLSILVRADNTTILFDTGPIQGFLNGIWLN